jgi:hypothetical protein
LRDDQGRRVGSTIQVVKEFIPPSARHRVEIDPQVWLRDIVRDYKLGESGDCQMSALSEEGMGLELS